MTDPVLQSQAKFSGTNSFSLAFTPTANLSSGSKLIFIACDDSGNVRSVTGVSDGNGNNFGHPTTTNLPYLSTVNGNHDFVDIWVLDTPVGDVGTKPTITASYSLQGGYVGVFLEVSSGTIATGTSAAAIIDALGVATQSATTGTSAPDPSLTSSASGEFLLDILNDDQDGYTNWTAPTGYTNSVAHQSLSDGTVGVAWRNSVGGSEAGPQWSCPSQTLDCQVFKIAFKAPAGSPSGTAAPTATTSVTTSGTVTKLGTATAAATTSVSATGSVLVGGSATPTASASVAAAGTVTKLASAAPAASASVGASAPPFATAVSSNGRYLVDQYGKPMLIVGASDQTWTNIATSAYPTVMAARAAAGFNWEMAIIIANNAYDDSTGTPDWATYDGVVPFYQSDGVTLGTGPANYDVTQPYEPYWARIDALFTAAAQSGITLLVDILGEAAYQTSTGFYAAQGNTKLATYATWFANRYKKWTYHHLWGFDHFTTISGGYSTVDPHITAMLNAARTANPAAMHTIENNDGIFTVATANLDLTSDDTSWTLGSGSSQMDLNFMYDARDNSPDTSRAYLASAHPVFFGEGLFENGVSGKATWSNLLNRKYLYFPMVNGACGSWYGHDVVWHFGSGYGSDLSTTAVTHVGVWRTFMTGLDWWTLVPDTAASFVTSGNTYSAGTTGTNGAVSSSGQLGLVYLSALGSVTVALSKMAGPTQAQWFDPTAGTFTPIGSFAASGTHTFTTSSNNAAGDPDWVLVLTADDATASATASVAAAGFATQVGTAAPASTTSVTATGTVTKLGTAAPAPAASVAVSGTLTKLGTAAPAASTTVAATGVVTELGVAAPTALTSVAATGAVPGSSTAHPAAAGSATVTGLVTALGTSSPASAVSVAASGTAIALGSAAPAAATTVTASGLSGLIGVVSPTAVAGAVVSAVQTAFGAALAATRAAITAIGSQFGSTIVAPHAQVSVQAGQLAPLGPVVKLVAPARTFVLEAPARVFSLEVTPR